MSSGRIVAGLYLAVASSGWAQDPVRVTVTRSGSALAGAVTPRPHISFGAERSVPLILVCPSGLSCADARATVHVRGGVMVPGIDTLKPDQASADSATFTLPRSVAMAAEDRELVLRIGGLSIPPIMFAKIAPEGATGSGQSIPLHTALATPCPAPAARRSYYEARENRAFFDVTPLGSVLRGPPSGTIDEDDVVWVRIRADSLLASRIVVRRTSEIRTPGGTRIAGEEVQLRTAPGFTPFSAGTPRPCETVEQSLTDFAPGEGTAEIVLRQPDKLDLDIALGELSFPVNPLYTGAFALALVRSSLANPEFGLAFDGTDSVITEVKDPATRDSDPSVPSDRAERQRLVYALFYIPFLRRKDLEKDRFILSPALGISFEGLSENAFVGASLSVGTAFFALAGAHMGRVRRLDPRSGLELGGPFPGNSSQIPQVERWKTDLYIGVGVDVRAAVKLLKVAFGGATADDD